MNEITKELLEALKHSQNVFMIYGIDRIDGDEISDKALEIINAAIAKAEAALSAPQPSYDDWIPWKGGECPVERGDVVRVKAKNGEIDTDKAHFYNWWHTGSSFDIVAYRVVKP